MDTVLLGDCKSDGVNSCHIPQHWARAGDPKMSMQSPCQGPSGDTFLAVQGGKAMKGRYGRLREQEGPAWRRNLRRLQWIKS